MADTADRHARETKRSAPRGSPPTPPQRSLFGLSRSWIVLLVGLLAFNLLVSMRAMEPASRTRVPYSPFFLQQVAAGNVETITSKGTDVQGTFGKQVAL